VTRVAVVLVAATLGVAAELAGQHATATLRGRVVAAATGDAIRNARVTVTADRALPTVLTDAEGWFAVPDVPNAALSVAAAKPGFARTSITIPSGSAQPLTLALARGAAISGFVHDEAGEPIPGASVMVERADANSASDEAPKTAVGITDDLGRYRVGGLAEGRVFVSTFATARSVVMLPGGSIISDGPGERQPRVYYPGGSKADAGEPLTLAPGDDTPAIDLIVPATVPAGPRVGPPPRDATVIAGRVLSVDGRPVAGAEVMTLLLASGRRRARQTVSDADGAYQLVFPPDVGGTFRMNARRPGFLPWGYGLGPPRDWPEPVVVSAAQIVHNDITLQRPGVIAGRVFDESGDPVEGAAVRPMRLTYSDGRRHLVSVPTFGMTSVWTDDLGRYRLSGLAPGSYFVSAAIGQILVTDSTGDVPGYAPTYYPGTPSAAEGEPVTVGRSQDVTGVDFSIARTRTARVAGRALDANGDPITGGLSLAPSRRSGALVEMQLGARIERDGRFEFLNVPPGEYVLQASRHRNGSWNEGESASMFVMVTGEDVTGIELRTTPGSTIRGRIVLEESAPLSPQEIDCMAIAVDTDQAVMLGGGAARALINADLTFEMAGLNGPRLLRVTRMPQGFALKAILHNGVDVTDTPLPFGRSNQSLTAIEVVLTSRIAEITGTVVDSRNRAATDAAIVVFPPDRTLWYPATRFLGYAELERDGTFAVRGLPPGEYHVAAIDKRLTADLFGDLRDPDVLESLAAGSQRVTLDEGQRVSVSLRIPGR
jgi:protocatechuate 3,4-dioxygenase beta subunit